MGHKHGAALGTRVAARLKALKIEAHGNDGYKLLRQKVIGVRPDLAILRTRELLTKFVATTPYNNGTVVPRPQRRRKDDFYDSQAWLELRYQVLKRHGPTCMLCGRTRNDGAQIHVDHIKPRLHFPELELSFENLQVLCRECNLGKRAHDDTDWRPAAQSEAIQAAIKRLITPRTPVIATPHLEVQDGRVAYVTSPKVIIRRPKKEIA